MATIYGGKCGHITESKVSMSFTEGNRPIYGGCSWERSDTNYGARPRDTLRKARTAVPRPFGFPLLRRNYLSLSPPLARSAAATITEPKFSTPFTEGDHPTIYGG